jgi:hypothetical protein
MAMRSITCTDRQSGRSSGVEHNLAKVGVEGSNPFARSNVNTQVMLDGASTVKHGAIGNSTAKCYLFPLCSNRLLGQC